MVTFFEPGGTFYLTQQRYEVSPWSYAIEISGREPDDEYAWQFSNGNIKVLKGAGQIEKCHPDLERLCFSQAILAITTAPTHFLKPSTQYNRQDAAVKKQGQWYYPIHKTGEQSGKVVFYQNRDTRLVDMIRVPCVSADTSLVIRGYDYQEITKGGPLVPARIEIFSTDIAGISMQRLVKIDCHEIVRAK